MAEAWTVLYFYVYAGRAHNLREWAGFPYQNMEVIGAEFYLEVSVDVRGGGVESSATPPHRTAKDANKWQIGGQGI